MLSTMLLMMGNSVFTTLLALRANIEGYPNEIIGLMTSAYFLGFAIGTMRAGPLINRVGHIRSFAAFAAIVAATMLSFLLIIEPWAWVVLRIVMGASISGLFVIIESWLNNRATNQSRGVLLSMYMMIGYLASAIGQQALQLSDPDGPNIFIFAGMLLILAVVPVALTRATHPDPVPTPHINLRLLIHTSPTSLGGCILGGMIIGSFWGLGPVYARESGLDVSQIASFMSIAVIGGLLMQLPIGRLSDRFDRRTILLAVNTASMLPSALLIFGSSLSPLLLFVAIGCFGGLIFTVYPLSVAYANDYLEPKDIVSTSAGFVLAFGVGAVSGPLAAAATMSLVGPAGLFLHALTATLALSGCILWRMRIRHWAPVMEKEPFIATPDLPAPSIVTDLNPRTKVDENYEHGPDTIDAPKYGGEGELTLKDTGLVDPISQIVELSGNPKTEDNDEHLV